MPDINAYLTSRAIADDTRAVRAWRRIQQKPTSITVSRGDVDLAAQTVRLEWLGVRETAGAGGVAATRQLVILGVAGHPDAAVPDTDLARGDRFALSDGTRFRIVDVRRYPGEIQATAERQTGANG